PAGGGRPALPREGGGRKAPPPAPHPRPRGRPRFWRAPPGRPLWVGWGLRRGARPPRALPRGRGGARPPPPGGGGGAARAGGAGVRLALGQADAEIRPGSVSRIQVSGKLTGSLARPDFSSHRTATGLALNARCPVPTGNCTLDFHVTAPAGRPLNVSGSSGDL